jgi:threonine dehydrogenase-like Zn-dependent dehydrogenase
LQEEVAQRYAIENIITHHFSLNESAKAHEVFDKKPDNCIKAVLLTS